MFLLDTNVVSALRKKDAAAVRWLSAQQRGTSWLSVMTLGEIRRGIEMKQRKDAEAARHLASWFAAIRGEFGQRVLSVNEAVALEWGRISALRTRGEADSLIAATAIVHDLLLVTRNVADFQDTGVSLVNPWDALGTTR
ncbi:type II toxin-antitoxin system VapC family toxin [Mesorhizobium sp. IMUNJ 23232]|uniref:type II toxin-antitoxin system VapC family toxin n=1 Tax=Mesorhizobium sp. IMUNJ 23232 TaxID=3376064 RepID=UPI0037A66DB7